ncbi:asparaginyl/glutamyl-tRNA amidotransferase subunit C [Bermanella sp. 47_1433_sub80_T6]|uniref:Asp-tRNA(Asn)/Glu-tRNA(Gln) amidotransferase subunit GatC n=1 Tax=Candidatus Halocynthiibacter alkanivorans TaxID=2267619 RepID=UPI000B55DFCA|nr:Asp-tRNA(Asn)/Glu-tRNA(Gln) amidotransferase subunit GatC [Candidatus Halocynthiibacter alkanivorans]OUR61588.1 asparaginyl/glutamyl-tRNA amidotransferase subunit C [Bermanella sp. 47_1433_sub80_T6]
MALDREDVKNIAQLARLELSDEDIGQYQTDLSNILELVEQMNAVNTDDVQPMAHPTDAVQRLRSDVVTETNQREKYMSNAPAQENGLFLVPKVID